MKKLTNLDIVVEKQVKDEIAIKSINIDYKTDSVILDFDTSRIKDLRDQATIFCSPRSIIRRCFNTKHDSLSCRLYHVLYRHDQLHRISQPIKISEVEKFLQDKIFQLWNFLACGFTDLASYSIVF